MFQIMTFINSMYIFVQEVTGLKLIHSFWSNLECVLPNYCLLFISNFGKYGP